MTKESVHKVHGEISKECLKKLKIMAITNEINLYEQVSLVLEKFVSDNKATLGKS